MPLQNETVRVLVRAVLIATLAAVFVGGVVAAIVGIQTMREYQRRESTHENLRRLGAAIENYRDSIAPAPVEPNDVPDAEAEAAQQAVEEGIK